MCEGSEKNGKLCSHRREVNLSEVGSWKARVEREVRGPL